MGDERMFPIQAQRGAAPHPTKIPWSVAELAYSVYSAEYGREQSLERLAERGGFGPGEMDMFLPDWRDRCSEVAALRKRVEEEFQIAQQERRWADEILARAENAERERDKLAEGYERRRVELDAQYSEIKKLQADLDALRATSAELDADRLRKHEELHRVKADLDAALSQGAPGSEPDPGPEGRAQGDQAPGRRATEAGRLPLAPSTGSFWDLADWALRQAKP